MKKWGKKDKIKEKRLIILPININFFKNDCKFYMLFCKMNSAVHIYIKVMLGKGIYTHLVHFMNTIVPRLAAHAM